MKQLIYAILILAMVMSLNIPLALAASEQNTTEQERRELDKIKAENPEFAEIVEQLKALYDELDLLEQEKESILAEKSREGKEEQIKRKDRKEKKNEEE